MSQVEKKWRQDKKTIPRYWNCLHDLGKQNEERKRIDSKEYKYKKDKCPVADYLLSICIKR